MDLGACGLNVVYSIRRHEWCWLGPGPLVVMMGMCMSLILVVVFFGLDGVGLLR